MSEMSNYLVKKSNKLISACYSLTVNEQRLLLACLSKVDSRKKLYDTDLFVVTVQQMQELFYTEENEKNVYRDLKEAAEKLLERKVRIDEPNSITGYTIANFVQAAKFEPDLMQVSIRFTYDLSPYLSELTEKFTEYRLGHIAQLTSSYAIRIYEMLVSWFGRDGKYTENKIEISKLRQVLNISNKYAQFGQLKDRVIDPAIQQINENTDFNVSVEFSKRGRAYHWITFKFEQKADVQVAEQAQRKDRKAIADQNRAAKIKREYAEQKAAEQQKAINEQVTREQAEQERQAHKKAEREQQKNQLIEIWENLSETERHRIQNHAVKNTYPAFQQSLAMAFETNNMKELTGRFFKDFSNALEPFQFQQSKIEQPFENHENILSEEEKKGDGLTEKSLAEKLTQMWKAGLLSQEEFLNLISNS